MKSVRTTSTNAGEISFQRVKCPQCDGNFYRKTKDRLVCGICASKLLRKALRNRTKAQVANAVAAGLVVEERKWDEPDEWWEQISEWPTGIRFEDATVPKEVCLGNVGTKRITTESLFGASQISKSAYWLK